METTEKADELISKFSQHVDIYNNLGHVDHDLLYKIAVQCAIIAVEEIISDYNSYRIKYWVSLEFAQQMRADWDEVLKVLKSKIK